MKQILWTQTSPYIVLTTLTSGPNLCMIVAENAAPATIMQKLGPDVSVVKSNRAIF